MPGENVNVAISETIWLHIALYPVKGENWKLTIVLACFVWVGADSVGNS